MRIRLMRAADIPTVHAVQCAAYSDFYHESPEVLESHLSIGANTCLVAEAAGTIVAYAFAHPWQGDAPDLHAQLHLPASADHLFLHDLAVLPVRRGCGAASALIAELEVLPAKFSLQGIRLIALTNAVDFWRRHGFATDCQNRPPVSYGEAILMYRPA